MLFTVVDHQIESHFLALVVEVPVKVIPDYFDEPNDVEHGAHSESQIIQPVSPLLAAQLVYHCRAAPVEHFLQNFPSVVVLVEVKDVTLEEILALSGCCVCVSSVLFFRVRIRRCLILSLAFILLVALCMRVIRELRMLFAQTGLLLDLGGASFRGTHDLVHIDECVKSSELLG